VLWYGTENVPREELMSDTDTESGPLVDAAAAYYNQIRASFLADLEGTPAHATAQKELPEWDSLDEDQQGLLGLLLSLTLADFASGISQATEEDYAAEGDA
jgi:hypothetical protein